MAQGDTGEQMVMDEARNTQRAAKRGYAVAASAASLEVRFNNRASAQTIVFRWGGDNSARETDVIERDGENISVPRYDDGRGDDCLEGEVATPAVLTEHKTPLPPSRLLLRRRCPCGPSPPAAAVGRASLRAICAAAESCAGTPSTMIAAGRLIEHEPSRSFKQGPKSW